MKQNKKSLIALLGGVAACVTALLIVANMSGFNVTYMKDVGDEAAVYDTVWVRENKEIKTPAKNPTKDGYTFDGWADGEGIPLDPKLKVTSPLTYYPIWNQIPPEGGWTVKFGDVVLTGLTVVVPEPVLDDELLAAGWVFRGWRASDSNSPDESTLVQPGDTITPRGDTTYYVVYRRWNDVSITSIQVLFHGVGVFEGSSVTAPAAPNLTAGGWVFRGWRLSTANTGDETGLIAANTVISNITESRAYYAVYRRMGDLAGTVQTAFHGVGVFEGASVTVPTAPNLTALGWEFIGWRNSTDNSSDAAPNNNLIAAGTVLSGITDSVTYYAVYRRATSSTWDYLGISGASASIEPVTETGIFEILTVLMTAVLGITVMAWFTDRKDREQFGNK